MDIDDVNIEFIVLSDKYSIGKRFFKYFVRFRNHVNEIIPFLTRLPKVNGYLKSFKGAIHLKISIKV